MDQDELDALIGYNMAKGYNLPMYILEENEEELKDLFKFIISNNGLSDTFTSEYIEKEIFDLYNVGNYVTDELQDHFEGIFHYNFPYIYGDLEDENGEVLDPDSEEYKIEYDGIIDSLFGGYGKYEYSQYVGWYINNYGYEKLIKEYGEPNNVEKYFNLDNLDKKIIEKIERNDGDIQTVLKIFKKGIFYDGTTDY